MTARAIESWIVVGVDGSTASDRALEWAVQEAIARSAGLEIVHAWTVPYTMFTGTVVVERSLFEEEAAATLDRATALVAGQEPAPPEIHGELPEDHAASALVRAADRAELLVVGSRGRGGFAGLVLGSVSQHCAVHARCAVAVVREHGEARQNGRIVVGVDGSEPSYAALHWAVAEAALRNTDLDVVNAFHYVPVVTPFGAVAAIDQEELEKASRALLREMVDGAVGRVPRPPRSVELITSAAAAAPALVDAARSVDLLVVGSRGRGGFRGLMLGSVSQQCLHHAACPVVVVHPPGASAPDATQR